VDVLHQFPEKRFLPPQLLFQPRARGNLPLQVFSVRGALIGSATVWRLLSISWRRHRRFGCISWRAAHTRGIFKFDGSRKAAAGQADFEGWEFRGRIRECLVPRRSADLQSA